MKKYTFFLILAIVTILGNNFSPAMAMEEKSEFELPESGGIITFGNNAAVRPAGGLDPPVDVVSSRPADATVVRRFEMVESGNLIEFSPRTAYAAGFGFPGSSPLERSRPGHATVRPPVFEAFELPESGRLVVFPRQVEKHRIQARRMMLPSHVTSDKN